MTTRHWLPALGTAVLMVATVTADDPKGAPGDPLPAGAKVRLGTTRMRDVAGWSGAALATDGRALIVLGPNNKPIKVDVATGTVTGGALVPGRPNRLELSADGTRGVTVGYEGPSVLDLATGATKSKFARPIPYGDYSVALSADGKVLAAGGVKDAKKEKVTALVWDVEKSEKRTEVGVLQNQSSSVAVSSDGTVLATWGSHYREFKPGAEPKPEEEYNRVAQFWDAASGKERCRYQVSGYGVSAVVLAPDGKAAVVVANGGGVWLIDTANGTLRRQLFGRADQGSRVTFSPDGKRVAVAGSDGSVQLYDAGTGARGALTACPVGPLSGGTRELKFTGPDTATAWAVVNSTAVVWEVPSGRLLSPTGGHMGSVQSIAFAAGGKTVATVDGGTVLRWDPATGKQTGTVRLRHPGRAGGTVESFVVQFGPDALTIKAGSPPALYDTATGDQLFVLRGASDYSTAPTLCADGRTLLVVPSPTGNMPKTPPTSMRVPVWDTTTGAKLTELELRFGTLAAAAISPDRKKVVTLVGVRVGETFKLNYFMTGWDLATGKKLGEVPVADGQHVLLPAPDNTTALMPGSDGKLAVVDFVAGKVVREIDTDRQGLSVMSPFSPDGKWFAIGSGYAGYGPKPSVRVYDWESGKTVRTFRGHESGIQSLAFSPDGKTLASGSMDTTVLLWDLTEK